MFLETGVGTCLHASTPAAGTCAAQITHRQKLLRGPGRSLREQLEEAAIDLCFDLAVLMVAPPDWVPARQQLAATQSARQNQQVVGAAAVPEPALTALVLAPDTPITSEGEIRGSGH